MGNYWKIIQTNPTVSTGKFEQTSNTECFVNYSAIPTKYSNIITEVHALPHNNEKLYSSY